MRLIDADNLKSKMETTAMYGFDNYIACGVIDDEPTVEAIPVVHAHWIEKIDCHSGTGLIHYTCSNCGYNIRYKPGSRGDGRGSKFCDDCGAMMDETATFDMSVKDCLEILKEIPRR